jgi:phosphoglycolate phosphatase
VTDGGSDDRLVVGFDLDMTLIDSRVSIGAAMTTLAAETGVPIDVAAITGALGPPLEVSLAPWFTGEHLDAAVIRFRQLHGELLHLTLAMPGAAAAVQAVHDRGGTVVVVTAKFEPHARTSLENVAIPADIVVGWRFGAAKGETLRQHHARAYVGDHVADVAAARAAGVISVSVATGSSSPESLWAAGTDVVLPDLLAFPAWLEDLTELTGLTGLTELDERTLPR